MGKTTDSENLEFILKKDSDGMYSFKRGKYSPEWEFSEPAIRKQLLALSPECQYEFLTSVAHPQAVAELAAEDEKPEYRKEDKDFYFNNQLMEAYLGGVAALAKKHGLTHVTYPLVEYHHTGGWPHHEAPRWPVMHVVPVQDVAAFLELARGLNNDQEFAVLKKKQAPHNYHLLQMEFLRNNMTPPLLVTHGITLAGETLKQAVNLLCAFSYKATERSGPGDD